MLKLFGSLRLHVLLVLMLAVAPLATLSVYLAIDDGQRDDAEARLEARAKVRLVKQDLDRLLQSTGDLILGFSRNPALARPKECDTLLGSLHPSFPQFANMLVTDRDNKISCAAINPANLAVLPHTAAHDAMLAEITETGDFAIGDVVQGSIVRRPIVPILAAISGPDGPTGTFFVATLDLRWVDERVEAIRIPRGAVLMVMDRRGTLVARNPVSGTWKAGSPAPSYEQALAGQADFNGELRDEGGISRIYSIAHAGRDAFSVAMNIPSAEIHRPARRQLMVHFAGLAIVALLVLGLTWLGIDRFFSRPFLVLTRVANRLANGDLGARCGLLYEGEIGWLARSLDEMADALERERTRTRTTIGQNEDMVRKLRALTGRLQSIREEERTHIAREIHDELGQQLTAMRFDLIHLKNSLREKLPGDAGVDPLVGSVTELTGLVDSTIGSVRRIATELRPAVLDTFGLTAAIEWLADDFGKRTHIQCSYEGPGELKTGGELATTVFRICQESLTNIARDAQATEVHIRLTADSEWITLKVSDNGRGISDGIPKQGRSLGLMGMRERARMAGGELEIESQPGRGTTVVVHIPLHAAPADEPAIPETGERS